MREIADSADFRNRNHRQRLGALVLLLVAVGWHVGGRLVPGWSADDGVHLRFSSVYPIREYLFKPDLLWIASYANLTPVLNFFYSINLSLFGLDAIPWRMAMGLLSVLAVAAYFGASLSYVRWSLALFAAATWALSVPFFYTTATFMTSHYVVGMVGASLAVCFYAAWMTRGKLFLLASAVLCYALAVYSKEVYAPLPALLLFHRPWQRSVFGICMLGAVAIAYLGSRYAVLGSFIGGYRSGEYVNSSDLYALVGRLVDLPTTWLGGTWQAVATGLVFVLFFALSAWRIRLLVIASTATILLPLLPLLAANPLIEPDRYFFVATAVALFLLVLMVESTLRLSQCPRWLAVTGLSVIFIVFVQQHFQRVPTLIKAIDSQAAIYEHALNTPGAMLMFHPGLPADGSYWSSVLNGSRETQSRLAGRDRYDKVLMVANLRSPLVFGMQRHTVPVYRFDTGCRCFLQHIPEGTPLLEPISLVPERIVLMHVEHPERRPENNQSALGSSRQTVRRISPHDPTLLEIEGQIDLQNEQDWLYVVLPFPQRPTLQPEGKAQVVQFVKHGFVRPFRLRLKFATAELARKAHQELCIAVPSLLHSPYGLLQGQPEYCNVFVSTQLH